MGNTCTKPSNDEKPILIVFEKSINIDPKKYNKDYKIKWNDKIKVYLYYD